MSAVTNTLMLLATITVMALLDPLLLVVTVAVLGGAQVVTGVVVPTNDVLVPPPATPGSSWTWATAPSALCNGTWTRGSWTRSPSPTCTPTTVPT